MLQLLYDDDISFLYISFISFFVMVAVIIKSRGEVGVDVVL